MTLYDAYGRKTLTSDQNLEAKASQAGYIISQYVVGQPQWSKHDYINMAEEAYILNSVSFRCAKLIATCAATIPWLLFGSDGAIMEDHPLLDLLTRPNPGQGRVSFFEAAYTYHMIAGHNFIEGVRPNRNSPYLELWNQRPDRMKPIPGKHGTPSAFVFEMSGQKRTWPVDPRTGESDILQIKSFHPLDDWNGFSRVVPGAFGVDRHNAASKHNKALLDNGARPSGALVFEPVNPGNGVGPMNAPQEVIDRAEDELVKRHGGPSNAGRPMVLGGNVKWEQFGFSMREMDFDENKQDAARDICLAWGVPHILVVKGQSTYNNMEEAKLQLYEETVLPLVSTFRTELNHWLTPKFAEGTELKEDLDSIPALELRREKKRSSVALLLEKGVIDSDEARDELDYGERDVNSVQSFSPQALTALLGLVESVGVEPLFRYMKSVGLVDVNATQESLINDALALLEGDEDEQEPNEDLEDENEV